MNLSSNPNVSILHEKLSLPLHPQDSNDFVLQALVKGHAHQDIVSVRSGPNSKTNSGAAGRATRKGFTPRKGGVGADHNAVVRTTHYRKDLVNRKHIGEFKLFTFPSFDRSDALLFVPTTLARHFNGGDGTAMMQLLTSRASPDCISTVKQLHQEIIPLRTFVNVHKLLTQLYPDVIMVVHATHVIGNQIHASGFVKFTSNKSIHDGVSQTITDPVLMQIFPFNRLAAVNKCFACSNNMHAAKYVEALKTADTEEDLQFHYKMELTLTVNDFTKKITNLAMAGEMISVSRVTSK